MTPISWVRLETFQTPIYLQLALGPLFIAEISGVASNCLATALAVPSEKLPLLIWLHQMLRAITIVYDTYSLHLPQFA